jgi:hypothetical protein
MMPCRSTKAFWAPIVTISDAHKAAPWEKDSQFIIDPVDGEG